MLPYDLIPIGEVIALGLGLASIGAALLVQCGGNKRAAPKKKIQHSKSSRSKSGKSKKSQRGKAAGPVKSKRSSRSQKKQRTSSRSSSKKSSSSSKKNSSASAVPQQVKKAAKKVENAVKRSVGAPQEVTARSKREKDSSRKSVQDTQNSESQKHQLHIEAAQAGQLPELQMEPRVLRFDKHGGLLKVQLHNPSSVRQAIKVKCSDNNLYRVSPVYAIIEPSQQLNVYVMRSNGSSKLDKIVFVVAKAPDNNTDLKRLFKESYGAATPMMVLPLQA